MFGQPRPWVAILLLGLSGTAFAQRNGTDGLQNRPISTSHAAYMLEDAELTDVCFVNATHGWAVGDRGVIWHTTDAGRTWKLQTSGVDCRLEAVQFLDERTGWAVGGAIRPYSHRSDGVVLRTLDGGRRWHPIPNLTLPQLKSVKFFSTTRGWAVGSPSALYGGGVFHTTDGGRSWTPVDAATEHWLCADFRDPTSGAIAGRHGRTSVVMTQGAIKSRTPDLGLRAIHDLKLSGETGGWLVGDGGLVMNTEDAGLTWQLPPRAIPPAALHEINFHTVTTIGNHIWVAGSPGTMVLHSPDGGRRWQLQRTGQSLPIKSIHFVDDTHGWAVGSLGTILATADGGQTWQRQHSGGTRVSVLFILADETAIPLEVVARLGADEGYLCAAEIIGHREPTSPLAASQPDRTTAAITAAGGTTSTQSWQFPLREKRLALPEERVTKLWSDTHDGRAASILAANLVRTIRTWRPDVIITHGEAASSSAEGQVIGRMVRAAAKAAGDTTMQPQQLTHADLRAWQVKKVFTICAADEAGDVSVSASALALRLSQSLSDYTANSRGLLHKQLTPAPTLTEFRLTDHRVTQESARRDFFSGITSHPGGEARRQVGEIPAGNIDDLRRLAQKRRNVEQLIAQTETVAIDDDAWLGQVNELTHGLDDAAAARLIYQLATRYANHGRADLAAETYQLLIERYHNQPITEQALVWLIQHYTSAEAAWRRRDRADAAVQPANFTADINPTPPPNVGQAKFDAPVGVVQTPPANSSRGPSRQWSRAIMLYKSLQQTNPTMAADPALQLAIASAQRTADDPRQAESIYRQIAGVSATGTWGQCAKAELWLRDPRSECPKPIANCVQTNSKPFLDGKLDDEIWKAAKPIRLSQRNADDQDLPTDVMLARDDTFLYIAVRSRRAAGELAVDEQALRTRDADLTGNDRVEILLDVNRDWNTAYRLTFDHRGWVGDAIDADTSWNPQSHVAIGKTETDWTIEAALPLVELGPTAPQPRDIWALGAQRITPGIGLQSWTPPSDAENNLSNLGLLLFE